MNGLYNLIVAVIPQGFGDDGLESLLLVLGGYRGTGAKDAVNEAEVKVLCVLGIVKDVVDVCTSVYECGEQEAYVRHVNNPVPYSVVEGVVIVEIA